MNPQTHFEPDLGRLFQEIAQRREVSLRALSRALHTRVGAVEAALQKLQREGLMVVRDGRRKARVNRHYGYVVGIDMGASHLHHALADFSGEMIRDSTEEVRPEDGPRKTITQIKQGIRRLAGRRGEHGRIQALAVGVPSPVDAERGLVAFANNLPGWKNIHLGRELARAFRVPVALENDANMAAIGEHWKGVARGVKNFMFIALGTGIGSGIFINGKLYRGHSGAAGELHRLNVEWPRWTEDFGDTGYFESHASGQGIAALGRAMINTLEPAEAAGLREERDAYFVFEAYRRGDPRAREVLEKIFTILAVGIANVAGILDPDLIVLGGGVAQGAPEFMLSIVETVGKRLQPNLPPIQLSRLEDKAQTYGAISSALNAAWTAITRRLSSSRPSMP